MNESPSPEQPDSSASESAAPASTAPEQSRRPGRRILWLGAGLLTVTGIALGAVLVTIFDQKPSTSPSTDPAPTAVPDQEEGSASASEYDLRTHQQLVSEVVDDLGREVLIGASPTKGNPQAEVVIFEFSDFQCPFCARAAGEVSTFMDDHGAEVLYVYKHLPLASIHPEAIPAAAAAWAADQQNQFWPFHDALFANQAALGEPLYLNIAQDLNLDMEQFNRDRASEAAQAAIARDLALAGELQLRSTPTFLMNELLIPGVVPADFFAEALARLKAFSDR